VLDDRVVVGPALRELVAGLDALPVLAALVRVSLSAFGGATRGALPAVLVPAEGADVLIASAARWTFT
jgi:hypothetical protein